MGVDVHVLPGENGQSPVDTDVCFVKKDVLGLPGSCVIFGVQMVFAEQLTATCVVKNTRRHIVLSVQLKLVFHAFDEHESVILLFVWE